MQSVWNLMERSSSFKLSMPGPPRPATGEGLVQSESSSFWNFLKSVHYNILNLCCWRWAMDGMMMQAASKFQRIDQSSWIRLGMSIEWKKLISYLIRCGSYPFLSYLIRSRSHPFLSYLIRSGSYPFGSYLITSGSYPFLSHLITSGSYPFVFR